MVIRIILYVVCCIGVFGFTSERELIPAIVCGSILIVPSLFRLLEAVRLKPSKMICPNCGCNDVFISERVEGLTTNTDFSFKRSFVFPNHRFKVQSQAGSKFNRQRVATCRMCGFDYQYTAVSDVKQARTDATVSMIIASAVVLFSVILGSITE